MEDTQAPAPVRLKLHDVVSKRGQQAVLRGMKSEAPAMQMRTGTRYVSHYEEAKVCYLTCVSWRLRGCCQSFRLSLNSQFLSQTSPVLYTVNADCVLWMEITST